MDNDFLLLLQAKLEEASLKGVKGNLDQLKKEFEELKIKPVLDQQALSNIVKQLESITGKKITIPNIEFNVGQTVKEAQKTAQQIASASNSSTATIIQNEQKKQQAIQETEREYQKIANDKSLVRDDSVFKQVFGTASGEAKKAQEHFKTLLEDEKAIVTVNEKFNDSNALQSFTVNIKRANGEVESLRYAMENLEKYTGKANDWHLAYQGGSINDANAVKQFEQLEKKATEFTNKLNDLKSKLTGTSFDFSGFENILTQFRNGEITVNQLSTAFNQLKNSAETSLKSLNSQSSSFNPIQQTQNNMRDLPSMITSLETNMNSLKDKTALANVSVQDLTSTYNSLKAEMDAVGGAVPLTDEWTAKYRELMSTVTALTEQVKTLKKIEASDNSAVKLANQANKIQLSMETGGYESKVESLIARTRQWTDSEGQARINTTALSDALTKLTQASEAYANNKSEETQKRLIESSKKLDTEYQKITNDVRKMNAEMAKDSAISSLHNQVNDFMSKNGKAVKYSGEFMRIFNETAQGAKLTREQIAKLNQEFNNAVVQARNAGKLGKTFFQTLREGMSSFSYWTSSTFLVMKSIQKIKESINFAKELNSALVNINYTMDVTASQLANIGNKSIDMAKDLHTSAENVLGAVKLYANAKETADSILAKAQPAIMLSNVTGFSGEESAKYLQTIMNQFDLTQDDLMDISDTIQGISQSMAHDFADGIVQINEGIATSGEIARAAGMELADYASMIGMLVEKTGLGGSQLGNSLKTIITRTTKAGKIMGIDEGEISAAETSLRSIGVEVRKTDGEFNAFNDTMSELAKHWDSLSDVEKSNISFNLAGTRQINVIQTLLRNWNEYEDLVNEANSSTGVTFENQEKYAASLEGKLKELSATTTSIGDNIFKSDDLSVIVNGLTKIAGLFDTITSKTKLLGSIGLGAGIFAGVKNIGETCECMDFKSFVLCF